MEQKNTLEKYWRIFEHPTILDHSILVLSNMYRFFSHRVCGHKVWLYQDLQYWFDNFFCRTEKIYPILYLIVHTRCSFYVSTFKTWITRVIFLRFSSTCPQNFQITNIRILIHTTHKHITTLFFKIPSLIPKDNFQSSTVVLHGWSHYSLEYRDYCGYEVTDIFLILNIHFSFAVSPKVLLKTLWLY